MKETPEELNILVNDYEFNIEKKLFRLAKNMKEAAKEIKNQREQIKLS